jgi:CRP/FNR family transcriptional regulator, cyclic AMP receptor protein
VDKNKTIKHRGDHAPEGPYFIDKLGAHSSALSALLERSTAVNYKRGKIIYLQGEEGTAFYYIKSGRVKVSITNREGYEKILAICESQTFIGEHIMEHETYGSTATALEDSELYAIDAKRFESLVIGNPAIGLMMLRCVKRKLTFLALQVADLCFLTAEGRVAHALLELADRAGQKTPDGIAIPEKVTHETLANLTGLSRPTVTIVLNDLEKHNILRKRRASLLIVDREGLERILTKHLL